jgi:hypothetical protein
MRTPEKLLLACSSENHEGVEKKFRKYADGLTNLIHVRNR